MSDIKTFDCVGCSGYCYGGYHMAEDKDGYGDWVRKEDHEAAVAATRIAALEEAANVLDNIDWLQDSTFAGAAKAIRALCK